MSFISPHQALIVKPPQNTCFGEETPTVQPTIGMLAPLFLEWARYEMRRAPGTIARYREALQWIIRDLGDLPVTALHLGHCLRLRQQIDARGC